ncbi:MAG: hypothetical protein WAU24_13490, partial [Chitinophagaceae bacterium]
MKSQILKTLLIVTCILTINASFAQWSTSGTNIYNNNSGNVGIGTSTTIAASAQLEVKSTTKGFLAPRMTKTQRDAIVSPAQGLLIYQTNNTPGFYYYDGSWKQVSPNSANKTLSNLSTPTSINVDLLPATGFIKHLGSTTAPWGNVYCGGIIASQASTKYNSSISDPQIMIEESENDYARLSFKNSTGASYWTVAGLTSNIVNDARLNFYNSSYGDVMSLTGSGNVGIGTYNPTYKLDVCGTIRAKEMRVSTGWCDYVFADDYDLMPLSEVEKFISVNK